MVGAAAGARGPVTGPAAPRPAVLCVLDGWGVAPAGPGNAIARARTPVWDRLLAECPNALLDASAGAVGLPAGQMGNSEVGHATIGAGRVLLQDLPRIDRAIANGEFAASPVLARLAARARAAGGTCHLAGLLSPGGVHAHWRHMAEAARTLARAGVPVAVHAFLDGRDTPPRSAPEHIAAFEEAIAGAPGVALATVCGRYWAMDRDRNWDRTARAWAALAAADCARAPDAASAVGAAYEAGAGDEFVPPTALGNYAGMADGDGLAMANFRADRTRQILSALVEPGFAAFARPRRPAFSARVGMVRYSAALDAHMEALFPPLEPRGTLGEAVAAAGLKQLRAAETEKYAHVTFFLNGGREAPFPGEDRLLAPSPKAATYDLAPEMSCAAVADGVAGALARGGAQFIAVNFANADMVGHTGNIAAAAAAVEAVDRCLGRIAGAAEAAGARLLVSADHGNAECMIDPATGAPHTAHTTNPVPVVLFGAAPGARLRGGGLADVAPTILDLLGLPRPAAMTGRSLRVGPDADSAARRAAAG